MQEFAKIIGFPLASKVPLLLIVDMCVSTDKERLKSGQRPLPHDKPMMETQSSRAQFMAHNQESKKPSTI